MPEFSVQSPTVAVLPSEAKFDVQCRCTRVDELLAQVFGDELRPVVSLEGSSGIAEKRRKLALGGVTTERQLPSSSLVGGLLP